MPRQRHAKACPILSSGPSSYRDDYAARDHSSFLGAPTSVMQQNQDCFFKTRHPYLGEAPFFCPSRQRQQPEEEARRRAVGFRRLARPGVLRR